MRVFVGLLLAITAYVTATLAYSTRYIGVIGGLVVFTAALVPLLASGFDRVGAHVRGYYRTAWPFALVVGPALVAIDQPSWLAVMALAFASPAASSLFVATFDHEERGRVQTTLSASVSKPFALAALAALAAVVAISAAGVVAQPHAETPALTAARFTASVGALIGSCAVWWMLLDVTAAALDREIASATSVLNACTTSDIALAATRMRVWRDGPLFRSTERVVAMLQHAMSGSSAGASTVRGKPSVSSGSAWSNPFAKEDDTQTTSSSNDTVAPTDAQRRKSNGRAVTVLCASVASRGLKHFSFANFLDVVTAAVAEHKGAVLLDSTGFRVTACWGLHADSAVALTNAVEAAGQVQSAVTSLVGLDEVAVRIGVAHGTVERVEHGGGFRLAGGPVDAAARLMELAVELEAPVLVDNECARCTVHTHLTRPVDVVALGDFEEPPTTVFEVVRSFGAADGHGAAGEWHHQVYQREQEAAAMYADLSEAFRCVSAGRISDAEAPLQRFIAANPHDHLAKRFLGRMRRWLSERRGSNSVNSSSSAFAATEGGAHRAMQIRQFALKRVSRWLESVPVSDA